MQLRMTSRTNRFGHQCTVCTLVLLQGSPFYSRTKKKVQAVDQVSG